MNEELSWFAMAVVFSIGFGFAFAKILDLTMFLIKILGG